MKRIYVLSVILISGLLMSCSDNPMKSINEVVEAEVTEETLRVNNNAEVDIYYEAIEQEHAAVANFHPASKEQNRIPSKSIKDISLSEIYGYETGDKIILNYWTTKEPSTDEIESIVVR